MKSVPKSKPTICLVGNAFSLNNSGLGEIIDSHDHVVRFNTYVTTTPEDTGKKVTHHAFFFKRLVRTDSIFPEYIDRANNIWVKAEPDQHIPLRAKTISKTNLIPFMTIAELPDLDPTVGLLAIKHIFNQYGWLPISIAGFGYSDYSKNTHYYDNTKLNKAHDLDEERILINRWISQGKIVRLEECK